MTKHGLNALLAVTKQTTALIVHTDSNITASTDNVLSAKENDVNKQKEIEEMAIHIDETCDDVEDNKCNSRKCSLCMSKHLVKEGYRKADEVRKETAKEILQGIYALCKERGQIQFDDVFYWAMKYGVGVDE